MRIFFFCSLSQTDCRPITTQCIGHRLLNHFALRIFFLQIFKLWQKANLTAMQHFRIIFGQTISFILIIFIIFLAYCIIGKNIINKLFNIIFIRQRNNNFLPKPQIAIKRLFFCSYIFIKENIRILLFHNFSSVSAQISHKDIMSQKYKEVNIQYRQKNKVPPKKHLYQSIMLFSSAHEGPGHNLYIHLSDWFAHNWHCGCDDCRR